MGLSSSQARLLNLTARMHQIEYKAQKLEAMKLQMANESTRVYEDYLNAVDATKIQYATITTDGSINYVDATYYSMKEQGYKLKFADSDKVVIDSATEVNLLIADGNRDYFIALQTGRVTEDNREVDGYIEVYTADQLMDISSKQNIRLMSDIDLTGKNWTSKSLSSGKTFDGNGHSITGLNNELIYTNYGTIQNLNIVDANINLPVLANEYAILAITNHGTIKDVAVSGSISGPYGCSGLVAYNSGYGKISDCRVNASVRGYYASADICMSNYGTITNTSSTTTPNIVTNVSVDDPNNDGALFDEIQEKGYVLDGDVNDPSVGHENDVEWFTNMVNAGELFIYDTDKTTGKLTQVSVSTDTGLQEVTDESALRKAEAKYEADMKKIDNKDKKYDTDLAALETERDAIKQEIETLKTVAKENVERTFKLFS